MVRKKTMKLKNRLSLIKTIVKNTAGSIQKIESWIAENKESTVGRKDPKQGFLHATFNINEFTSDRFSSLESKKIEMAGATWLLKVIKRRAKKDGKPVLGAYLWFKAGPSSITYDTDYTIRLVGSVENIEFKSKHHFNKNVDLDGFLIHWERLINFTNGFVDEKGNFEVRVIFSVMGKTNTDALIAAEFLTSGFVKSDCILLVENRQFPVNKGFLSSFSSYFKSLFFAGFREKNQEQIELTDVCAAEFLHLLEAIYPPVDIEASKDDVIRDNVECLLRLANYYQVDIVTKRCEVYLKKCPVSEVALENKILYAQDYRLPELLRQCIKELKTVNDVKKLRQTSQYSRLADDTKHLINEIFFK